MDKERELDDQCTKIRQCLKNITEDPVNDQYPQVALLVAWGRGIINLSYCNGGEGGEGDGLGSQRDRRNGVKVCRCSERLSTAQEAALNLLAHFVVCNQ